MNFGVKGGKENVQQVHRFIKTGQPPRQCGSAKTLAIHPASTTHEQLNKDEQLAAGVRPNQVRISVGIEHINDIKADFQQAFEQSFFKRTGWLTALFSNTYLTDNNFLVTLTGKLNVVRLYLLKN